MAKKTSKQYTLVKEDLLKIVTGAGIAISGAVLTALASIAIPELDINANAETLITVVILQVVVNTARKLSNVTVYE